MKNYLVEVLTGPNKYKTVRVTADTGKVEGDVFMLTSHDNGLVYAIPLQYLKSIALDGDDLVIDN